MVVKFSSQSRIVLIWPRLSDEGPANDGRLRTANIQGFKILQWRSLPIRCWFGYHTSQALTISLNWASETPFRRALTFGQPVQIMAIPPLTWMVCPVT